MRSGVLIHRLAVRSRSSTLSKVQVRTVMKEGEGGVIEPFDIL